MIRVNHFVSGDLLMQEDDKNNDEVVTLHNHLSYFDVSAVRSLPFGPVPRPLVFATIGALVGLAASWNLFDGFWRVFFIMGSAVYFAFLDLFSTWRVYKRNAKNTTATFEFRQDAIYIETEEGLKSKVSWQKVIRIEQKRTAIAIQMTKKPDMYYWFPLRRFHSSVDAEHFLTKANEFWTHWLMTASLESIEPANEDTEHPGVDVEITLMELIICDTYLMRNVVIVGLCLFVFGAIQTFYIWTGILVMVLSVYVIAVPAIGAWTKLRHHPNLLTGRTTITEEGIRPYNKLSGHDTVIGWNSIRQIYSRHGMLFFELMNRRAVVVPLRCFKTKEAGDEFVSLANEKWSLHKTKSLESATK